MPINMCCPSCGRVLAAPDSAAGKRAKCPACGQVMIVPELAQQAEPLGAASPQPASAFAPLPSANGGDDWAGGSAEPSAGTASTATGPEAEQRRPCPICGEMIVAVAAKCRFCGAIFDPRLRGAAYRALGIGRGQPAEQVQRIRSAFTTWWVCLVIGAVAVIAAIAIGAASQTPELFIVGVVVGGVVALLGGVYYLVLLYRLWSAVQDGRAQTTPGNAVGFLFIPCFNIYWQFVAVWGLSKELNRISREYNFAAPEVNEGLALTICILHCCSWVPYAGAVAGLVGFILSIVVLKSMCDTAVVIVGAPAAPTVAGPANQPYYV